MDEEDELAHFLRHDTEMRRRVTATMHKSVTGLVGSGRQNSELPGELAAEECIAAELVEILNPLVKVEVEANEARTLEEWLTWRKSIEALDRSVMLDIQAATGKVDTGTQSWRSHVTDMVLADPVYAESGIETLAVVKAILNEAWQRMDCRADLQDEVR